MRKKKYLSEFSLWAHNREVYNVVVALCADYERRKKEIAKGKIDSVHLEYYKVLNDAIDRALEQAVDSDIREQMLIDISNRTGHRKSKCCLYMHGNTFKAQKSETVYHIAKNLQLI